MDCHMAHPIVKLFLGEDWQETGAYRKFSCQTHHKKSQTSWDAYWPNENCSEDSGAPRT